MNDPIYKAQPKPYTEDLNDLVKAEIEKGGQGSGVRGHTTSHDDGWETSHGMKRHNHPEHGTIKHKVFRLRNDEPVIEYHAFHPSEQYESAHSSLGEAKRHLENKTKKIKEGSGHEYTERQLMVRYESSKDTGNMDDARGWKRKLDEFRAAQKKSIKDK